MKSSKNHKNVLYLLFLALFILNTLMFDYLSWKVWWHPILHVPVGVIMIWVGILSLKAYKKSSADKKSEIKSEIKN